MKNWIVAGALLLNATNLSAAEPGFVVDWTTDFDRVCKKLLDLAAETPADRFGWRPSEDLRSISEVYIHVASNNFFFARDLADVPLPEGYPDSAEEKILAKDEVIETLRQSQERLRQAVQKAATDPDRETDIFGRPSSIRSIFMFALGHSHEHLGQSIAYARSVDVVPPWSQGR